MYQFLLLATGALSIVSGAPAMSKYGSKVYKVFSPVAGRCNDGTPINYATEWSASVHVEHFKQGTVQCGWCVKFSGQFEVPIKAACTVNCDNAVYVSTSVGKELQMGSDADNVGWEIGPCGSQSQRVAVSKDQTREADIDVQLKQDTADKEQRQKQEVKDSGASTKPGAMSIGQTAGTKSVGSSDADGQSKQEAAPTLQADKKDETVGSDKARRDTTAAGKQAAADSKNPVTKTPQATEAKNVQGANTATKDAIDQAPSRPALKSYVLRVLVVSDEKHMPVKQGAEILQIVRDSSAPLQALNIRVEPVQAPKNFVDSNDNAANMDIDRLKIRFRDWVTPLRKGGKPNFHMAILFSSRNLTFIHPETKAVIGAYCSGSAPSICTDDAVGVMKMNFAQHGHYYLRIARTIGIQIGIRGQPDAMFGGWSIDHFKAGFIEKSKSEAQSHMDRLEREGRMCLAAANDTQATPPAISPMQTLRVLVVHDLSTMPTFMSGEALVQLVRDSAAPFHSLNIQLEPVLAREHFTDSDPANKDIDRMLVRLAAWASPFQKEKQGLQPQFHAALLFTSRSLTFVKENVVRGATCSGYIASVCTNHPVGIIIVDAEKKGILRNKVVRKLGLIVGMKGHGDRNSDGIYSRSSSDASPAIGFDQQSKNQANEYLNKLKSSGKMCF